MGVCVGGWVVCVGGGSVGVSGESEEWMGGQRGCEFVGEVCVEENA